MQKFLRSLYLSYDITPDETWDVAEYKTEEEGGEFSKFTAEEMLVMILKYSMGLAENHARSSVKDVVITVPPYMGVAETRGLLMAADLSGTNVLALVNEHSGAALQYGINKDFSNGTRHVMFHSMTWGPAVIMLPWLFLGLQSQRVWKDHICYSIPGVRWDAELGGQNMKLRLVEYFADEFNKQLGNGVDVRNNAKAMAKLKKQPCNVLRLFGVDLLVPDEAAVIPLPIIDSLFGKYLFFLPFAVNGCFYKLELNETIMYASGDLIESWMSVLDTIFDQSVLDLE
ncbi:Heat shock 70 kDa protein 17 [Forsythia ovata]|uniref:Heat shock 70 kDa protein 17 n=1 Tax=Forsythia ovata TaxID=205694 RepID=A0ABD1WDL3_9LAMI